MYDLDDNPLANGSLSVESAGSAVIKIKIDCRAGYILRVAAPSAHLTIEGRFTKNLPNQAGSDWTDLEQGAIDLSSWNGSRETFEIRLTGESVEARTLETVVLSVEPA